MGSGEQRPAASLDDALAQVDAVFAGGKDADRVGAP
jgi:hypothetical protein